MATVFSITTAVTSLRTDAQGRAECAFTVSNASGRRMRGRAEVKSGDQAPRSWFTLVGDAERDFAADGTDQFAVRVAIPPGSPAGKYSFRLEVVSAQNPDEDFAEGPAVSFNVAAPAPKRAFPWWIIAVAVLVVGLGVGLYFWLRPSPANEQVAGAKQVDSPGSAAKQVDTQVAAAKPVEKKTSDGQLVDTLPSGAEILVDHSLKSTNGQYSLILQADGNLVLYRGGTPLWASNTMGKASRNAVMQADGNFVLYDSSGRPLFNSSTQNHPGAILRMQDDGNAVIYEGGRPIWATGTDNK